MRPVPATRVFSRVDLRALGWSDSAIGRAACGGRLVRLRRDQFAIAAPDPQSTAIAAARACSGSVISHRSAAPVHGIPLLGRASLRPDLTVQPGRTGDVVDALLHRATLRPEDVVEVDGAPVTTAARTAFDLARHLPTHAAVAAFDFVLHENLATVDELDDLARFCWNWPGSRRARRALRLADARAESPLESVSRLVLRWLKVPAPELQVTVFDEFALALGRLDFYWDEYGVMGEADGRSKYDVRQVLTAEKLRQEQLEDTGLVAVRWGWSDVTYHPRWLKQRVERGFERGLRLKRSGFPRRWSV